MLKLLTLLLFLSTSLAREIPEFDDELLGKLIVSKAKFPFLTPKTAPDLAHVYPTDQQLDRIKKAIGGPEFALRSKRASNATDDGFPSDPTSAFVYGIGPLDIIGIAAV